MPQFPLYLRDAEVLSQTSQFSWVLLHLKHIKISDFQNKWIVVWQLAFRARKVLRTFGKQAPDHLLHVSGNGVTFRRYGLSARDNTLLLSAKKIID